MEKEIEFISFPKEEFFYIAQSSPNAIKVLFALMILMKRQNKLVGQKNTINTSAVHLSIYAELERRQVLKALQELLNRNIISRSVKRYVKEGKRQSASFYTLNVIKIL